MHYRGPALATEVRFFTVWKSKPQGLNSDLTTDQRVPHISLVFARCGIPRLPIYSVGSSEAAEGDLPFGP
jgi:hypothetical protein